MISENGKKKLLAFHGLDPEKHNDSDVDDAIKNAVTDDDLESLQNRAKAAEDALVEADLARYANRIGKDPKKIEQIKQSLVSNRAATIVLLEAIPEPRVKEAPLHVANRAENPNPIDQPQQDEIEKTKLNALILNRAEKLVKEGTPQQMAFIRASQEIPIEIMAGLHR